MSTGAHLNIRKPTAAQIRALGKLLPDEWRTAHDIDESNNVLDALVKRKEAEVKYLAGSISFPGSRILYRLL